MIKVELVITVHELLIERYGGVQGIRDSKGLESALVRPFMTFEGKELYPTPILKAGALIESLIKNHPFIDGNKRIGYVMTRFFLMQNGLDINATQQAKFNFVINIANGHLQIDQITDWITEKIISK
jgi:death-on-curing protein